MTSKTLRSVVFEPRNRKFTGLLALEDLLASKDNPEPVLKKAAQNYEQSLVTMKNLLAQIQATREAHKIILARTIWQLGDAIFELRSELNELSLELSDIYGHLVRDLGVKRKWLEKVIILRRYIPNENLIPPTLNWGRCGKAPRKIALKLRDGLPLV